MNSIRTSTICKRLSICIIDDDPTSLQHLTELVKNMSCERYMYFPSILNALNYYNKFYNGRSPDLIISEWYRGFTNSYFMESKLKDVPIVIVTAPERSSMRNSILERHKNVKAFLDKPIDWEILRILLRKLFRRKYIVY